MKLFSLCSNPNKPCLVLTFKGTSIMLDCGLDQSSLLHFMPRSLAHQQRNLDSWKPTGINKTDKIQYALNSGLFKQNQDQVFMNSVPEFIVPEVRMVEMKDVDAILISNSYNMLALPFITEYTNFQGRIYVTEPALQVGRMIMEELVHYLALVPGQNQAVGVVKEVLSSLPPSLQQAMSGNTWRHLYTLHDINTCLTGVDLVGFNEKINILGTLTIIPSSSGQSLGSCNWTIQSAFDKIVYLSSTSTLTTHPKPLDHLPLKNADIMIVSNLTPVPTYNPDTSIREFSANAAMALRAGGNVLVPCYPSGVTFDLFECLSAHLDTCGLSSIPIYFISPQAESCLAFANIFAEWLSHNKLSRVYLPEFPFPHADLQKSGRLQSFTSINDGLSLDYRQPCVVFTGHPSLRFGDVTHFIHLWGKSNANLIIFTEPEFNYLEALQPYQPLNISVQYHPIDTSLNFTQANKLIKDLAPNCIVCPQAYLSNSRPDLRLDVAIPTESYKLFSVLKLPIKPNLEQVEITRPLADTLVTSEVRKGVFWSPVTATISVRDGRHVLDKADKQRQTRFVWGRTDIDGLKRRLLKHFQQVNVDEIGSGYLLHLPDDDSLIRIEGNDTHIIANSESTRIKIRDALLDSLSTL